MLDMKDLMRGEMSFDSRYGPDRIPSKEGQDLLQYIFGASSHNEKNMYSTSTHPDIR